MFKALRDSNHLFQPFIKSSLGLLLILFFVTESFQNYFLLIISATQELQSANLPAMFGQVLTSLLEFVVLTMLVPLRIIEHQNNTKTPSSFISFTQKHIGALTAESLRSLAVTLIWALALLLPGIFKYIRLAFVPFVVVADKKYELGERDALERSNQLVKGITFQLFILLIGMVAIEYARGWMRETYSLMQNPIIALMAGLCFFAMNIYANILLFRIYQLRVEALPSDNVKETPHAT